MKRADELRIQLRWRRNLEHAANSHPFIGPLFANGRPLSVEQASTWLKACMRQAQSHVRLISTQPEQAFELLRERLQAASHCSSPIHLCISGYQGCTYPNQGYYLIPDLPVIETSYREALSFLSAVPRPSLSFFACALPDGQTGVALSTQAALPQPENDMFDGVEYELSHWGQHLAASPKNTISR